MHSTETINQFLNLRAQGWSFARIADHLHVSKPTLIQWSHKHQTELAASKANYERSVQKSAQASYELRLEHLTLFHTTLRQEIIKRTLQTLSDEEIQTMADAIQHQIEKLTGLHTTTLWSAPAERSGDGALVDAVEQAESTPVQPSVDLSSELLSKKQDALTKGGKETR
jgi:hypothetical protein